MRCSPCVSRCWLIRLRWDGVSQGLIECCCYFAWVFNEAVYVWLCCWCKSQCRMDGIPCSTRQMIHLAGQVVDAVDSYAARIGFQIGWRISWGVVVILIEVKAPLEADGSLQMACNWRLLSLMFFLFHLSFDMFGNPFHFSDVLFLRWSFLIWNQGHGLPNLKLSLFIYI